MKAIEAIFQNYRMRSRLEARWAVCFEKLGLKWEYEKEGYQLEDGLYYLPDFWLPYPPNLNFSGYENAGHWFEVKGVTPTKHELTKLLLLSILSNHSGILVVGPPWDFERYFTHRSGNFGGPYKNSSLGLDCSNSECNLHLLLCRHLESGELCEDAIMAAKQARFEHGENG